MPDDIVEEKVEKAKPATKKAAKKAPAKKAAPKINDGYAEGEDNRAPEEIFEEMEQVFSGITAEEEFQKQRKYYLGHPAVQFPADLQKVKELLGKFYEELTS